MTLTRQSVDTFLERPPIRHGILVVILVNALVLGLMTSKQTMAALGPVLIAIDQLCLAIFVVEILLKLYARGMRFFRSAWSVFDLLVIAVSLLPGGSSLTILRALRVLRLLRVLSAATSLRRVVEGLVRALPGMGSVAILIVIIYYVASVMATTMFGDRFEEWFGTIGASAYSLFQIMTLESWSMGIVRPVMEAYPQAWAFFVPFIMITSFVVLNLLVGLVVNAMQEAAISVKDESDEKGPADYQAELLERLDRLEALLADKTATKAE